MTEDICKSSYHFRFICTLYLDFSQHPPAISFEMILHYMAWQGLRLTMLMNSKVLKADNNNMLSSSLNWLNRILCCFCCSTSTVLLVMNRMLNSCCCCHCAWHFCVLLWQHLHNLIYLSDGFSLVSRVNVNKLSL